MSVTAGNRTPGGPHNSLSASLNIHIPSQMHTTHVPPFSFLKLHFHYNLQLHLGLSVVFFFPASLSMYWTARNIKQITPHTDIPPHCALILCITHTAILNNAPRSLRLYSVATRTKRLLINVFYTHIKPLKHRGNYMFHLQNFCILHTQLLIFVFRLVLTIDSDCFPKQH